MNLIDSKYIGLVSSRLGKFKRVQSDLYNFRCPICGDSKKNKTKTRGYLYTIKADVNFRCHNCGASMTFSNFLKEIDPVVHKQYVFERFKQGSTGRGTVVEEPVFKFEAPTFKSSIDLPLASTVDVSRIYLEKRKLDPTKFYYAERFVEYVNSHKQSLDVKEHPRIIIPLYYEKNLVGVQGRTLNSNSVKYITTIFYDEAPKIYGLDNIRRDAPVFVQKDHLTARSYSIALLCAVQTVMLGSGVLAILFGFMITSQGLRKLQKESPMQSQEVIQLSSGQQV